MRLEKAKDITKLTKKTIVNKNGKKQTVWIRSIEENTSENKNAALIKSLEKANDIKSISKIIWDNRDKFVDKDLKSPVNSVAQLFIARAGFVTQELGRGKKIHELREMKNQWNSYYTQFLNRHEDLFNKLYKSMSFKTKEERYLFNLMVGAYIELEHTDNIDEAIVIAQEHLSEFDNYYEGLMDMEEDLKKSFNLEKSQRMGLGTTHRTPSGKLVKKIGEGKWVEVRDEKSGEKKSFRATGKDEGTSGEAGKQTKTADGLDLKEASKHKGKKFRVKGHGKEAVNTRYHGIVGEFTGEFNHEGKPKLKIWDKIKNAFSVIAIPAPVLEMAKSVFTIPQYNSNKIILLKADETNLKELQSFYDYEDLLLSSNEEEVLSLMKADRAGSKYLKKIKLDNGKYRYIYEEKDQPKTKKMTYSDFDNNKESMLKKMGRIEKRIKELSEKKRQNQLNKTEGRELETLMIERNILKKQYDKRLKSGAEDRLSTVEKKKPSGKVKKVLLKKTVAGKEGKQKLIVAEVKDVTKTELQQIKDSFDLITEDNKNKINILSEREILPMKQLNSKQINEIRTNDQAMANFLMDNERYWWKMAGRAGINYDDREDAVQEIKLKVWELLKDPELKIEQKNFKTIGEAFATYVWSIARFKAMAFKNSIQRHEDRKGGEISSLQEWEDGEEKSLAGNVFHSIKEQSETEYDKQQEKLELRDELERTYLAVQNQIDKKQKEIFDHYLLGYTQEELAEKFGFKQSNISYIINKIKKLFTDKAKQLSFAKSIILSVEDVLLLKSWGSDIPLPLFKSVEDENIDCLPFYTGGEWHYFFKSKKVPIGTIANWQGKKMKKTANGKWEPVGNGNNKKDQKKPDDKAKKQTTKPDDKKDQKTVKYSDEQKGKIKGFMKKFLEFIGDIFTSHDVGMGKVAQAAGDLDKEKKQVTEETPEQKRKKEKE